MTKLTARTATAVGVTAVSMAVFGTAVAAADDYAGQTYADVSTALSKASLKGVIASRAGDTLSTNQCRVTRSENAKWIRGDKFAGDERFDAVKATVLLYLNCNATVASATTPGNSAASPEGRAAIAAAKKAAVKKQAAAAAPTSQ